MKNIWTLSLILTVTESFHPVLQLVSTINLFLLQFNTLHIFSSLTNKYKFLSRIFSLFPSVSSSPLFQLLLYVGSCLAFIAVGLSVSLWAPYGALDTQAQILNLSLAPGKADKFPELSQPQSYSVDQINIWMLVKFSLRISLQIWLCDG